MENGYVESFNGKLRDEFLNGEVFNTLAEAQILIEWWRREYNQERTRSALGYRPPAPKNTSPQGSHFDWPSFRGEDQVFTAASVGITDRSSGTLT